MSNKADPNKNWNDVKKIAQSSAGIQLAQLLRSRGGPELNEAMNSAARGDYQDAKKLIQALMADPSAQELLKQLEI